jgi:hypothetical protein
MAEPTAAQLLERFCDAVDDVTANDEAKAEVVINLARAWGLDDVPIQRVIQRRLGAEAADHPYFHWQPRARYEVGAWIRVVDGAPQVLGKRGQITSIEHPKRLGVRGMARGFFYNVAMEGSPDPWGFREEQLEQVAPPKR